MIKLELLKYTDQYVEIKLTKKKKNKLFFFEWLSYKMLIE